MPQQIQRLRTHVPPDKPLYLYTSTAVSGRHYVFLFSFFETYIPHFKLKTGLIDLNRFYVEINHFYATLRKVISASPLTDTICIGFTLIRFSSLLWLRTNFSFWSDRFWFRLRLCPKCLGFCLFLSLFVCVYLKIAGLLSRFKEYFGNKVWESQDSMLSPTLSIWFTYFCIF